MLPLKILKTSAFTRVFKVLNLDWYKFEFKAEENEIKPEFVKLRLINRERSGAISYNVSQYVILFHFFQGCATDCQQGDGLVLETAHTHTPLPGVLGSNKSDNSGSNHSQSSSSHFKPYVSPQSKNNSVPASLHGGLGNSGGPTSVPSNNNSCGANLSVPGLNNIPVPGLNNFSSIALSTQIQKSLSPTTVPTQGGMSPTPAPGRPREQPQPQQPQQQQQLLQPQPKQQPTPSFAGINKSDGSPGGTGAKRPRKGSGGSLPLKLSTSQVPVNSIDVNVSYFSQIISILDFKLLLA